jgi:hypothetical protein
MAYWRFLAMIVTSTLVMFGLMYLNSYSIEHVYFSETRTYMALYMGATMAVVMLAFMLGMYSSRIANLAIFVGAAVVFGLALFLVRSQVTVQDQSWMRAMIPHHSIAIMTSERAEITDARARKLADEIITAQNREIAEMRYLIEQIEENGEVGENYPLGEDDAPATVEALADALRTPVIAGIRPAPMSEDEVSRGLDSAGECRFVRAVTADPVLATAGAQGVTKISGSLIRMEAEGATDLAQGGALAAEGIRMTVNPRGGDDQNASLVFELLTEPALRIGFDGYWTCNRSGG